MLFDIDDLSERFIEEVNKTAQEVGYIRIGSARNNK